MKDEEEYRDIMTSFERFAAEILRFWPASIFFSILCDEFLDSLLSTTVHSIAKMRNLHKSAILYRRLVILNGNACLDDK